MIYIILIFIFLLIVFLLLLIIDSYSEYKKFNIIESDEKDEEIQYHKEKHEKIKAQYYRGIEIEAKSNFITQECTIVGFEKPIGKWTKMVIGRNFKYMSALKNMMGNNFSKLGIWQLKVKTQSLISQVMNRGKGR